MGQGDREEVFKAEAGLCIEEWGGLACCRALWGLGQLEVLG